MIFPFILSNFYSYLPEDLHDFFDFLNFYPTEGDSSFIPGELLLED